MKSELAPVSNVIEEDKLNEQAELLFVRNLRLKVTKSLLVAGAIPDDPNKLDFLLRNLKDMDGSAIARSKIKSDEKVADQTASTIGMVTNVLTALRGGKALPPEDITDILNPEESAPKLPGELDTFTFVPGESQIGSVTEDIDTFRARMARENPDM
jgi:hypothetical protein